MEAGSHPWRTCPSCGRFVRAVRFVPIPGGFVLPPTGAPRPPFGFVGGLAIVGGALLLCVLPVSVLAVALSAPGALDLLVQASPLVCGAGFVYLLSGLVSIIIGRDVRHGRAGGAGLLAAGVLSLTAAILVIGGVLGILGGALVIAAGVAALARDVPAERPQ